MDLVTSNMDALRLDVGRTATNGLLPGAEEESVQQGSKRGAGHGLEWVAGWEGFRGAGCALGPEGRKNGSPWREPWVGSSSGFRAPEGRQNLTPWGWFWQNVRRLARPGLSDRPSGAWGKPWGLFPWLTPWARVLTPRPALEIHSSWEDPCSKPTCSRTMNRGFRGARRPPLRQAGRPPLRNRFARYAARGRRGSLAGRVEWRSLGSCVLIWLLVGSMSSASAAEASRPVRFRAGAAMVDIAPTNLPGDRQRHVHRAFRDAGGGSAACARPGAGRGRGPSRDRGGRHLHDVAVVDRPGQGDRPPDHGHSGGPDAGVGDPYPFGAIGDGVPGEPDRPEVCSVFAGPDRGGHSGGGRSAGAGGSGLGRDRRLGTHLQSTLDSAAGPDFERSLRRSHGAGQHASGA